MNNFCQLSIKDTQEVSRIHKDCLQEHWSYQIFQDILSDSTYHSFCLKKESIVGFLIYRDLPDNMIEILTFVVRPDCQGKGYGSFILSHFITKQLDHYIQEIILEVRESNKIAMHLYHKFGFEIVGRRKNYYPSRDGKKADALLLRLDLKKNKIILA